MSRYKAVIFDLDGTLLDTLTDIRDSMNQVMAEMRQTELSYAETRQFVGLGVNHLVDEVIRSRLIDSEKFAVIKQRYLDIYRANSLNSTAPYPGIVELLDELKSRGLSLNVLSNKPDPDVQSVIAHFFTGFSHVYGKKPEYAIKPDPASAKRIIDDLGLKAEEVLYVGDTATDIETAKNAGLTSVGVLWGFRDREELVSAGADHIISRPGEILAIIKE